MMTQSFLMLAAFLVVLLALSWPVGALLARVADNANRVLTAPQLLRSVWGPAQTDNSHYLRIYMVHLRHKLEDDPTQPQYLVTKTAIGYRLQVPV